MKFKGLIIIIILLVLTAVIGVALPRIRVLLGPRAAGNAVLSLPAGPVSATSGTEFTVPITLASGGSIVRGVDVVLTFDATKLSLTGIDDTARINGNASFRTFVPGVTGTTTGILDAASVMTAANSSGKVEFGAVTYDYAANQASPIYGLTPGFNGTLILATAKFTSKSGSSGTTNIAIDFTAGSTTDSNVVDDGPIQSSAPYLNDALGSVSPAGGLAVNITSSGTTPTLSGLSFKMQGILATGNSKTVNVNFTSGTTNQSYSVPVTSGSGGVFSSTNVITLTGLPVGTYDVFVKDSTHLRKKLGNVSIIAGANTAPTAWSSQVLKAGDFDNNNVLNAPDVASILNQYTQLDVPVASGNGVYDVDGNNSINLFDLGFVLANYISVNVNGD